MKLVHVLGRKNHGKTTLIVELIRHLSAQGLRVGTIKHTHHAHQLDTPGKDSFRHAEAGAAKVGILSRERIALFWSPDRQDADGEPDPDPYQSLLPTFADCDLVLVEGDTHTRHCRVEVWRAEIGSLPLAAEIPGIAAVITDDELPSSAFSGEVPQRWPRGDIAAIAQRLLEACCLTWGILLVGASAAQATDLHQQHMVFENSTATPGYYHSRASVVPPSSLQMVSGRCPVATEHYVSPPNSLKLQWQSRRGGDWRVTIDVATRYGRQPQLHGDTLCLWCYSVEGLAASDAPRIGVRDSQGNHLPEICLLRGDQSLPAGKWVELRLPFAAFAGLFRDTRDVEFDSSRLAGLTLVQGLDDDRPHQLYLDDIRVLPGETPPSAPPAAPRGLQAEAFERHIDIAWQPDPTGSVLSYRVDRSRDGEHFEPLTTRRGNCPRVCDFVGTPSTRFHYRVTAIDVAGRASPPSQAVAGTTRVLDDNELLDMVQRGCFRYYWEAANPNSGMALEILPGDPNLVAVGASGFGVMALVAATDRGIVSRDDGAARLLQIVRFLRNADRFHGVWPHFLDGRTGKVWPYFGKYDNGGDLVETAFMIQGLLTARQYFDRDEPIEREIRDTVTNLWHEVQWDWYRKTPDGEVLYWHWSPDHEWHISHPLIGWNETLIVYLLAIASPTHPVPASMYHTGWAGQSDQAVAYRRNWSRTTEGDHFTNGRRYYDHLIEVGSGSGGDLFFTQFSCLGFDPRGRRDRYTNYFRNNQAIALVNRAYCIENPRDHVGYGEDCWGLSAGINSGGGRPLPRDDNGTICCSASLGCFPYTPAESLAALKHFYRNRGAKIWGAYGFHDGFNATQDWYEEVYMGLNQAQIVVGIENHRTGLLWKHFMANPEIEPMLSAVGFVADDHAPQGTRSVSEGPR
jgi:molybdopterin-guanine dinucleotide biosynthesis protein MobB